MLELTTTEKTYISYARGIDLKINGEFVEGIHASLSWLHKRRLFNDFYYNTNQNGKNYTWIYHRSD